MQHQQHLGEQGSGLHLGAPQFEPMGIDAMPFDYGSQFVPSMDSPNINIDYNQQQVIIMSICTDPQTIHAIESKTRGISLLNLHSEAVLFMYNTFKVSINAKCFPEKALQLNYYWSDFSTRLCLDLIQRTITTSIYAS